MPRSHPVRHFDDRDRALPRARAMRPVRQHPHAHAHAHPPTGAPPLTRRRRAAEPNAVVLRPPPTPPGSAAYQRVPTPAPRRPDRREPSPTRVSAASSDSFHSASSHLEDADVDAAVLIIDSDTDAEPHSGADKRFDARAVRTWEAGRRPAWAPARDGDAHARAHARALKDTVMARAHMWVAQQVDAPTNPPRQQPTAAVRRMAAMWEARQDSPPTPPSPQARSPVNTRPNAWVHHVPHANAVSWGDVEEASISWVDDESPPPLVSVTPPPVVPSTPPPQTKARPNSWESWGAVEEASIPWVKRPSPTRGRVASPAPAPAPAPARHTLFVGDERSQPTLRLHAPLYEEQTSAPIGGLPRSAPMPATRTRGGGGGSSGLPKGRRGRGRRARTDVHTVVAADGISMFHDDFVDFQTRAPRRRRRGALRILSNLSAASAVDEWDGEYTAERERETGDHEAQTPFPSGVPTYAQAHAQRRGWRAALRRARLLSRLG